MYITVLKIFNYILKLRLWALKKYHDEGFVEKPLELLNNLVKTTQAKFKDVIAGMPNNIGYFIFFKNYILSKYNYNYYL